MPNISSLLVAGDFPLTEHLLQNKGEKNASIHEACTEVPAQSVFLLHLHSGVTSNKLGGGKEIFVVPLKSDQSIFVDQHWHKNKKFVGTAHISAT